MPSPSAPTQCFLSYHIYPHLLGYTTWRTSSCFPSHFKGLYLTYMQPVFLWPWLQSSLMKSGSVATLCCRAGEEANHCLCRRPGTVLAAMALPSWSTDPKIPPDPVTLWLPHSVSLSPKLFHLGKSL